MDKLETSFEAWKFTEEELAHARRLDPILHRYLQTLLADAAEEKLAMEFDEKTPLRSAQREAYVRGQMDILNMLLGMDTSVTRPKRYKDAVQPQVVNPQVKE